MDSQQTQTKRRMARRTKKTLAALCSMAGGVIAAGCFTNFIKLLQNAQQWAYSEQTVQQGTLKSGVTESGTVAFGITSQLYDLDVSTEEDSDDEDDEEEAEAN